MRQPITVAPEGEIDIERVGEFRAELASTHGRTGGIVIDVRGVSVIDSSGLGALVDLHSHLRRVAAVIPP